MQAPTQTLEQRQEERKAEFKAARNFYIIIILSFVTICTVAVMVTMKIESEKQGFQAIQTDAPISFFDRTYMKKQEK